MKSPGKRKKYKLIEFYFWPFLLTFSFFHFQQILRIFILSFIIEYKVFLFLLLIIDVWSIQRFRHSIYNPFRRLALLARPAGAIYCDPCDFPSLFFHQLRFMFFPSPQRSYTYTSDVCKASEAGEEGALSPEYTLNIYKSE